MKAQTQILVGGLLAALLTGCAGYNTTMFMTKSNAGLDFDAKPPTAEINISRKEAVIAPAFEGGQTPPVMASFKPEAGMGGGFQNFFLGVDQTFAGGDAAATMSELYNSPATGKPEDSTLVLTTKPKYKNAFQRLAKPGEVRPFIFGTDTMLGLKVAWSGVGGQFPDSLKAGFNRKEFAWAPLTMSNVTVNGNEMHHVRMPSFLATIDSQQTVTNVTEVSVSALQYFATGKAATALAVQPDVRAAMLWRLDPNTEKFKRLGKIFAEGGPIGLRAQIVMEDVYEGLKTLKKEGDKEAATHLESLDALGKLAPPPDTFVEFRRGIATNGTAAVEARKRTFPPDPNFKTFVAYQSALRGSIQTLTTELGKPTFEYRAIGAATNETVGADSPRRTELTSSLKQQQKEFADLAERVSGAVTAALRYYAKQLTE